MILQQDSSLNERDLRITETLLQDYKRINPSVLIDERQTLYVEQLKSLFIEHFGIPPLFFSGKKTLDIGCGTGETTRALAELGCIVDGVDFNDVAVNKARSLFQSHGLPGSFFHGSVYGLDQIDSLEEQYDIVSSFGVMHHLPQQKAALRTAASRVRTGGLLLLAVGTGLAGLQFLLIKKICRLFQDKMPIQEAAMVLFEEWINRCAYYGHRTPEAVINDNIVNSQHDYLRVSDLIAELNACDMRLMQAFPTFSRPTGDSLMNNTIDKDHEHLMVVNELSWACHVVDDAMELEQTAHRVSGINKFLGEVHESINGNVDESNAMFFDATRFSNTEIKPKSETSTIRRLETFAIELSNLMQMLTKRPDCSEVAQYIQNCEVLFKGTAGLNMNYFSFFKREI